MSQHLKGKNAVITGAAGGVGREVCLAIAREGANIVCNDIGATRMTMNDEVIQGIKKRAETGIISKEQADRILSMPGPEHIPPIVVYLATDYTAGINGQVFYAEAGRVGIYNEPIEVRAVYKADGIFTTEELTDAVPKTLLQGYLNLAPPQPKKE